ncbi:MAG: ribonuclease H-like domain-containing protein [Kurthia sp.]|nr:ribonuclease H-like domain-containing protein [Candidatus Kurthia equi]
MSYEKKILQMKQMLKKNKPQQGQQQEQPVFNKPVPPIYAQAWHEAGMKRVDNDWGVVFVKETNYPLDYQHGKYKLGEFYAGLELWDAYEEAHPLKLTSDDEALFYDTETTGLKGTGTHIFLNGILQESSKGFTLKQYVLANPSHEAAFLYESKFWQGQKMVITYNGKSFDWPQLQTRWTLNRNDLPPLKNHRQIDLFHSSKRIWKNDLQRMKLSTVEEEKLDFHRVDDMPGYLAPMIYLDAVRSGDSAMLLQVLKHNEYDLLSLITLFIQATELVFADVEVDKANVHTNIGKWYNDLKQTAKGSGILSDITASYAGEEAAMANYLLAAQKKRQQLYEEAKACYLLALPYLEERQWIDASIELAKLYEHQLGDLDEAEAHTLNAFHRVKKSQLFKPEVKENKMNQIEKRYVRLRKKQG